LDFSLCIEATGSKVPCPSLVCALAAFVPDATWAGIQAPPTPILEQIGDPSFDVNGIPFRHVINGSLKFDFADLT
jgi:hypothetical protein